MEGEEDRKEKKKKRNLKKILKLLKSNRPTFPWLFFIAIGIIGYIILSSSSSSVPLIKKETFASLKLQRNNVVTFSKDYTNQSEGLKNKVFRSLKESLNLKFHILCMHHLEFDEENLKLCVLRGKDMIFNLVNPKIIDRSNETQVFEENSISCGKPIVKERYKCIEIAWLDYRGKFCNEKAFAIQLAIDEMEDEKLKFCII